MDDPAMKYRDFMNAIERCNVLKNVIYKANNGDIKTKRQ